MSHETTVILGHNQQTPQYGIIGERNGDKIGIDLNRPNTISLFGLQGSGKSYTLGAIAEMAMMRIDQVNVLPSPMATVFFHYSASRHQSPELCSMISANDNQAQLDHLINEYQAKPEALNDIVMLTSENYVGERQREYPNIKVHPLKFSSKEMNVRDWRFLMGAVGNQSIYIRQLTQIMREIRDDLSIDLLLEHISKSDLSKEIIKLAKIRLNFAREYIDDTIELTPLLKPGRLIIVDLRDELIEEDQILGLVAVLLNMFSAANTMDHRFSKLIILDECHKYMKSPDVVELLTKLMREKRHTGASILMASQDPPSVPSALIELSNIIFMHKSNSPSWLKHMKNANTTFDKLSARDLNALKPGEAYVWANEATHKEFMYAPMKVRCRPRVTKHGGDTLLSHGLK